MQIKLDQLETHLNRKLAGLYVLYGDEPLLIFEAVDKIRAAAKAGGYTEREILSVESGFNWQSLIISNRNLSLFGSKKILELRIPSGKPGVEGAQAIQTFCKSLNDDTVLLVTLPKLDRQTQSSGWFTALEQAGVAVAIYPVERAHLPQWIASRLIAQKQNADTQTLQFLADRVEGNLLAAFQEVQKLGLLYPAGQLSFEQVKGAVLDVARYDIFQLGEALLAADAVRFTRVLEGLKAEGEATTLVLWQISEEIHALSKVRIGVERGLPISQVLRESRVWGPRQNLMEAAARRCSRALLQHSILHAARIDAMIKGLGSGDVWDELRQIGLRLILAGSNRQRART